MSASPRIVLGVAGGIAAYKVCEVLRGLKESGSDVVVVPTANALKFVGASTWEALSGHPVSSSVWDRVHDVAHVRLGQSADCIVVAPATADLVARAAVGLADDLLTNVLLTARCPIIMAPAMHTEMWEHPATQANVATLRARGVIVLDPAVGRLTGADTGPGRLPDPAVIVDAVHDILRRGPSAVPDLQGHTVVISAGGTREAWDPVRFIGNHSSGRQGVALARTALARGARVVLVAGAMEVAPPAGARVVSVTSAEDMRSAMHAEGAEADVIVMAAAVADYRPDDVAAHKIKKSDDQGDLVLPLVVNADILAELVAKRGSAAPPLIVGFAAETGDERADVLTLGREKLARKGCDLLVVNDVSAGVFGSDDNAVVILGADGTERSVPHGSKLVVSEAIWDEVAATLRG